MAWSVVSWVVLMAPARPVVAEEAEARGAGAGAVVETESAPLPENCFSVEAEGRELRVTTHPLAALPEALRHGKAVVSFGAEDAAPGPISRSPDGWIYFAATDRGFDVTASDGRRWRGEREGAVFRCRPDGSALELYARGLRRPTVLAFDDWGALWVADAGFFPVPEGFDGRWHAGLGEDPEVRAAWETERREAPAWQGAEPFLRALATWAAPMPVMAETPAPVTDGAAPPEDRLTPLLALVLGEASVAERRLALWELADVARSEPSRLALVRTALVSDDPAWRAGVLRVLGETRCEPAAAAVRAALADPEPMVAAAAVRALGRLEGENAEAALAALWPRATPLPDPVAQAVVVVGAQHLSAPRLARWLESPSQEMRLVAVEALRRQGDPLLWPPAVAVEADAHELLFAAARAGYDAVIEGVWPGLSRLLDRPPSDLPPRVWQRAIEAALDLGRAEDAVRVAGFAQRLAEAAAPAEGDVPDREALLRQAVTALSQWDQPPAVESVGRRPRRARPRARATAWEAWQVCLPALAADQGHAADPSLRLVAVLWQEALADAPTTAEGLFAFFLEPERAENERLFHLRRALAAAPRGGQEGVFLAEAALRAGDAPRLRMAAREHLFVVHQRDVPWMLGSLSPATPPEKQHALRLIGARRAPETDAYLLHLLRQARVGSVDPAVLPELLEAVERRTRSEGPETRSFREALEDYRSSRRGPSFDDLRPWRPALEEGDAAAGREFFFSARGRCASCHALDGAGGLSPRHGPDLTGVAARLDGRALLESITLPDRRLADGYGVATATLRDGVRLTGRLTETGGGLRLHDPDGGRDIPRSDIASITPPASPCRPMGALLTLKELRDLVTFLRGLP